MVVVVVVERLLLADALGVLSAYGDNHYRFVHGNDVVHDAQTARASTEKD